MSGSKIWTVLTGCFACGTFFAIVPKFANGVTGGLSVPILALVCFLLYLAVIFSLKSNRNISSVTKVLTGAFAAAAVSDLGLLAVFFRNGEYFNRGMAGMCYAATLCIVPFLMSGVIVTAVNRKKKTKQ